MRTNYETIYQIVRINPIKGLHNYKMWGKMTDVAKKYSRFSKIYDLFESPMETMVFSN